MGDKIELLSIGDATYDVFLEPTESETLCEVNSKECLICFSYGDKIPVRKVEYSVGGNAANNSVGARRLGINSALVSTLGDDNTGNIIVEKIKSEGVNTDCVIQQKGAKSRFSTVINYAGERTIFTYNPLSSYEFPNGMPVTPWIYLTSMGEAFEPFYKHVIEFVGKNPGVKIAFNPGSRQIRADIALIKPVLENTEIIYVNREEAQKLTGMGSSTKKEKKLLENLSKLGPKVCIVTDGGNGSYLFDSESMRYLKCGVLPVDAYERTGAGDAFGSGFMSAIISGKKYSEALLWGTVNSASVIGYTGAQRGLLKVNEIPNWLERAKSCGVEAVEI